MNRRGTGTLRLRTLRACLAAIATAALLSCGGGAKEPNLVIITIDTLRAGHLGCYGYFRDTSPDLDELASESVFFERCLVPMATTLPSHTSLFTATYPIEHGILANIKRGGYGFVPSPHLRSYAEIAKSAGYETAAFVSAAPLNAKTGINAGFDTYDTPPKLERRAEVTNEKVFAWLESKPKAPYMLWVHYYDPHFPYEPLAPYDDRFFEDDALLEYMNTRGFAKKLQLPNAGFLAMSQYVNQYDGEILYTNDRIAELLAELKKRSDWGNTIVVVTSDHGEGVGQHARTGHSYTWEEQLHAPLFMRVPGQDPRRIAEPLSLVDALPTLLALAPDLPRGSFLDQATGSNTAHDDYRTDGIVSQDCKIQRHDPDPANYTLSTNRWKFFYVPEANDRLYDITTDPYELRDVSGENADTLAMLKDRLLTKLAEQQARGAELKPDDGDTLRFDPKLREELEALGYTN